MPGRKYSAGTGYRYGFNGKENDNEVKGEGNQQDYGMRIYDPRVGRFLSVDPLTDEYPELTPYQFSSNTPISAIDLDGMESVYRLPDGTFYTHPYGPSDRLRPPPPPPGAQLFIDTGPDTDKEGISTSLDVIPGVGQLKGIAEAIVGKDIITGKKLSAKERALGVIPYVGKAKKITKALNTVQKVSKTQQKVISAGAVVEKTRSKIKQNKKEGDMREAKEEEILKKQNPDADVQGQRYLRDADGNIVKDPVTGEGRRIDHVVIQNKKALDAVETTSQTANKKQQMEKEARIRNAGGTYVRDKKTKELVDVKDVPTRIKRHD